MRINNNINLSMDLNPAQLISIKEIVQEVNQHGFYSTFCVNLYPTITEHTELIREIRQLAIRAKLKVTFNAEQHICIFEQI